MGTLIMDSGAEVPGAFERLSLNRPEIIENIHRSYVAAGAQIIETNTFGANPIKLAETNDAGRINEMIFRAVDLAKKAAGDRVCVCGSVGPIGKLLEPIGSLTFEEAFQAYSVTAKLLMQSGADLVSIETISDLQEMRAAVLAFKDNTNLPIIASMTYDESGRTNMGTSPEAAVAVLEGLGVDVIGANCSMGPEGLVAIAKRLVKAATVPVMIMPNAGKPILKNGKAVYKMTPEKFAQISRQFLACGVKIIGGCCGTTPEHIKALASLANTATRFNSKRPLLNRFTPFASRTEVITAPFLVVGEKINPTGRKLLREEIKAGKTLIVRDDAEAQAKAGADLLDVNMGVGGGDEKAAMKRALHIVMTSTNRSVSIDSPDPAVIQYGLREFCGRVLINSVNGGEASLTALLPEAKKFGASIIALCLDETGVPETAKARVKIADRIIKSAKKIGIPENQIYVDCLVMTAGLGPDKPLETLKALKLVKQKYKVKTILGVSNVSHGLPNRPEINAAFLELARAYGLDAGIVDPTDPQIKKVLSRKPRKPKLLEKEFVRACLRYKDASEEDRAAVKAKNTEKAKVILYQSLEDIRREVIAGNAERVRELVRQALGKEDPQKIISAALVPAMQTVGKYFSGGKYFLPQVVASAESMQNGFELCKEKIPPESRQNRGTIIVATVKGDIHDIGKNIVKMLLENNGFRVVDLGKDIPAESIVEAVKRENAQAVALSALLTTTMLQMETVKKELALAGINIPVIVGGAVVTPDYAQEIGAIYGKDAVTAVELAEKIMKAVGR